MSHLNPHAYKVFLATAYPQRELVGTMKRFLACLALCASLSVSAQDDNCTVLGVQELSLAYSDLNASIDSITSSLVSLFDSIAQASQPRIIIDYDVCYTSAHQMEDCVLPMIQDGWELYPTGGSVGPNSIWQALVKYADD
jgi:hypothetical protein